MWWLNRNKHVGEQVRTLTADGGVLNQQTFWRIVRTERERADRSGMPVTVAIFTIAENREVETKSGSNATALCNVLRSTARLTDHVGIAGDNEIGVLLWGTRELGAYRYVKRLGKRGDQLAADCRLFVYPILSTVDDASDDSSIDAILNQVGKGSETSGHRILDRISDVEQKLAQAIAVETPVVKDQDVDDCDESMGFGFDDDEDQDDDSHTPPPTAPATGRVQPAKTNGSVGGGVAIMASPAPMSIHKKAGHVPAQKRRLEVVMEPLENLFLFPHPMWKRALDVVGSAVGVIVLSPVLLAVAVLIKLTSPGPALFTQLREGHGGRLFTIFKFRTMRIGADAEKAALQAQSEQDGPAFKMTHDPRITPVGSFLRKTCLDELPQLWNVLKGDMTLVGPRPLDHRESERIARWGRRRMLVMPGLTCIWQVHGKSKVSFNEWMRMDIRYSQRVNFKQDIALVLQTLKQVLLRQASQ